MATSPFQIVETCNFKEIEKAGARLSKNGALVLDMDQTLTQPSGPLFAEKSVHKGLIDFLKKPENPVGAGLDLKAMVTTWRLGRETLLVHKEWPEFIRSIQGPKYVLTQMDIGPLGPKTTHEAWRRDEIEHLGIELTPSFQGKTEFSIPEDPKYGLTSSASFSCGIFLTGQNTKEAVMNYILGHISPEDVVFVDDKKSHVEAVGKACLRYKIPYTGIVDRGIEVMNEEPHDEVATLQVWRLSQKEWLSNKQAFAFYEWILKNETSPMRSWIQYGATGPWYAKGQEMEFCNWLKNDKEISNAYALFRQEESKENF